MTNNRREMRHARECDTPRNRKENHIRGELSVVHRPGAAPCRCGGLVHSPQFTAEPLIPAHVDMRPSTGLSTSCAGRDHSRCWTRPSDLRIVMQAEGRHGGQPGPAPRSPATPDTSNHGATVSVPPCPPDSGADPIRAAARTAVEIAAVEAQADPDDPARHRALVRIVDCVARVHDMPIPEICDASGLDHAYVSRLLQEAGA